ncbi:MAG TPA: hypothetical protein VLM79_12570 [Kofleriaceae bacterium]|nr:hypothetical protein [Kofleriaceae bacterium]
MRDRAPLTHRTLGDFTVGEKLGEGGYGVVYRAEQRGLGREAVIKVLTRSKDRQQIYRWAKRYDIDLSAYRDDEP